jgi:uncharacterized protein (DUF433 family)
MNALWNRDDRAGCRITQQWTERGHMSYTCITIDPARMGGVPCLRGLRIPVAAVVEMVAEGMSDAEILDAYRDLERDDIREAPRYAAVEI